MKRIVNPTNLRLEIKNMKVTKDGSVIVNYGNIETANKIKEQLMTKVKDKYLVSDLKKKQPRMIIYDVNKDERWNDEEFCMKTLIQNKIDHKNSH